MRRMKERAKSSRTKKKFAYVIGLILLIAFLIVFAVAKIGIANGEDGNLYSIAEKIFKSNILSANSGNLQLEEVKSISMETDGYSSNTPGSWHLDKSAEWTAIDKAKITFDVKSVMKTVDTNYKDVILVLDISGSMSGDKLQKVKDDSTQLVESLLSTGNNKVALIVYDDTAETKIDFSKDSADLVSKINELLVKGCTNYNDPLKHVDSIMENYEKQENRDVVTLFLTDGYPNVDTPNQVATYQMLKSKYPYMAIKGIQYEMGATLTNEIIEISDEQYIASMETLDNVLFEAVLSPIPYEEFKIEDIINNEYFIVGEKADIEVTTGKVDLTEENGIQKVIWTIENALTGFTAKMTINVTLKDEYIRNTGAYPSNKETTVTYKEEGEKTKTKQTTNTPVLIMQQYQVVYEANAPTGKTVTNIPETKEYWPFENVTKERTELTLDGWNFKGWEMITENVTNINEDTFVMPASDVTIRATWGKPSISKSMEGTVATVVQEGVHVKYAVQIYGINQDEDASGNKLGLTFGPATGADYNNAYVTHEYEETETGSGIYKIKIVTTPVDENGNGIVEKATSEYLKNSSGLVTRDQEQVDARKDINLHTMTWAKIAEVSKQSSDAPYLFEDCMLCGDTKSVNLYLNDTIKSGTEQTAYGDGAGVLYDVINTYYRKWNPSKSNNAAATNGIGNSGSNARSAGGYSTSHI